MKNLIPLLISLAILLPSSAIGANLFQWKSSDRNMIDLVTRGFNIVSHSRTYDPNKPNQSKDIFILQKPQSVYKCIEDRNLNLKTDRNQIECRQLVSPYKD